MRFRLLVRSTVVLFAIAGSAAARNHGVRIPAVSPESGAPIVIAADRAGGGRDLLILSSAGEPLRPLITAVPGERFDEPSFSPDGRWILAKRSVPGNATNPELYVFSTVSGVARKLFSFVSASVFAGGATWSHDGRWIVYSDGSASDPLSESTDLFVIAVDLSSADLNGMPVNLTNTPDIYELFPSLSPDDRKITCLSRTQSPGPGDLLLYDIDTAGGRLTNRQSVTALIGQMSFGGQRGEWTVSESGEETVLFTARDYNGAGGVFRIRWLRTAGLTNGIIQSSGGLHWVAAAVSANGHAIVREENWRLVTQQLIEIDNLPELLSGSTALPLTHSVAPHIHDQYGELYGMAWNPAAD